MVIDKGNSFNMIASARRQPAAFSHLRAGPVVVGDVRYGTLERVPDKGWRFIPEVEGLRSLIGYKPHPEKALPAKVRNAIQDDYDQRNPPPWKRG